MAASSVAKSTAISAGAIREVVADVVGLNDAAVGAVDDAIEDMLVGFDEVAALMERLERAARPRRGEEEEEAAEDEKEAEEGKEEEEAATAARAAADTDAADAVAADGAGEPSCDAGPGEEEEGE
ncbi:hypothetical protein FNF31_01891 [Cafeteria roenbergensis]|uniref:Uncharacterized protein n=1 Tax=Cafeteria roenbergensis TaxID=33653 RepID=A0A5A8DJJ5_CAFRO|nr:hypothetical protein FNF31_01891 [Cafeteria roenbergensis]